MELIFNPSRENWEALCVRNIPDDADIEKAVEEIVGKVRDNGDRSLL